MSSRRRVPRDPPPSGTGPSGAGPSGTGPSGAGPTATGPTATGPTATGPMATGPMATGPTGADGASGAIGASAATTTEAAIASEAASGTVTGSVRKGDGRRERWAGHREARRAEMVAAAIAAIAQHGPGIGMDDVAAAAGVTKPVVYRYFADKADLYLAVGQQAAAELMADVLGAMTARHDPREMLAAAVDAYLARIEASPDLYRFVVSRPSTDRAPGPDVAHDYQALIAAGVARSLGRGLRDLGVDSGGAEAWAHGIVGYVRAAGDWWLERQGMSRADLCDYLVTLLWGGIVGLREPVRPPAAERDDRGGRPGSPAGLRLLAPSARPASRDSL